MEIDKAVYPALTIVLVITIYASIFINMYIIPNENKRFEELNLIKTECEKVCLLNNSQDNYFKCCKDCYEWESLK